MTRTALVLLTAAAVWAAGCGGSGSTAATAPSPGPQPPGPTPAPPAADLHEMDPAKHTIPDRPAVGRLRGKPFTPDRVELEGGKLTFRQGKDFFPDLEIAVFVHDGVPAGGTKLTVRPSQKWTDGVPSLHVSAREGDNLPDTKFVNDEYAMTLELGKAEKGKVPGKVYLCLPDAQKSYLAGTFTAERKRALNEPPGPEDVPYIQGKVAPAAKKGQSVWVGYVGLAAAGEVISDGVGAAPLGDEGTSGGGRSMTFQPRTAGVTFEKFTPRFDFTRLPPGRYLVFARFQDGPAGWKWVDVKEGAAAVADLALDPAKVGTVEATVPADAGEVRLTPTDLGSPPPGDKFLTQLGYSLDLKADAKGGKATLRNVPAGKYLAISAAGSTPLHGEVEVAPGKTATVELKPGKK